MTARESPRETLLNSVGAYLAHQCDEAEHLMSTLVKIIEAEEGCLDDPPPSFPPADLDWFFRLWRWARGRMTVPSPSPDLYRLAKLAIYRIDLGRATQCLGEGEVEMAFASAAKWIAPATVVGEKPRHRPIKYDPKILQSWAEQIWMENEGRSRSAVAEEIERRTGGAFPKDKVRHAIKYPRWHPKCKRSESTP